jgi:hypothetical protein
MQTSSKPWWRSDTYDVETPLPGSITVYQGPKDVALVRAWADGRTDQGWGLNPPPNSTEGFMPRYLRGEFNPRRVLFGFDRDRWNFAIVMRSVRLVAIDIDGKNGGIEHAKRLMLPPTTAETSKSGDGYHLFYRTDEEWDDVLGFAPLGDRIGFEQGVDFRATGCVYHHKSQRWNHRIPALLPEHVADLLKHREQKVAATNARITKVLANDDPMEVLMLHDEILDRLKKPIDQGKRNNTLFAIGAEMKAAGVEDWETLIITRADEVGLDVIETEKLVGNINRYAQTATP